MVECKPHVKVILYPPSGKGGALHGGFCHGCYLLLKGIEREGALLAAAKGIGMAYSKAWKLTKAIEADFGIELFDRDGAHGSVLTDDGRAMVELYERVMASAHRAANDQV